MAHVPGRQGDRVRGLPCLALPRFASHLRGPWHFLLAVPCPAFSRIPLPHLALDRSRSTVLQVLAGQMLFLPAGWFHDVTSLSAASPAVSPAPASSPAAASSSTLHMAFNYWFHPPDRPDFSRPYWCPSCSRAPPHRTCLIANTCTAQSCDDTKMEHCTAAGISGNRNGRDVFASRAALRPRLA